MPLWHGQFIWMPNIVRHWHTGFLHEVFAVLRTVAVRADQNIGRHEQRTTVENAIQFQVCQVIQWSAQLDPVLYERQ